MSRSRGLLTSCLAVLLAPLAVQAQQSPRLGFVYPAGGRQGTTFEVRVGGQYLDGVNRVHVSGTGVQATLIEQNKPVNPGEINQLRTRLRELLKSGKDAEKEIAAIRRKLASVRRTATPAIGESVYLQVTIAPDAEPGQRDLRLETMSRGLSNPLVICVGQLPECCEPGVQLVLRPADPGGSGRRANNPEPVLLPPAGPTDITLPTVVNGQIMPFEDPSRTFRREQQFTPGDVDRFRFQARKGQQLVGAVSARELVPYLADAVPGWFQATLTLYDTAGNEVAYNDDYRFHPDPVLFYKIPEDGQYVIEIKDALYRGRADFVYRLTIGELPYITSIFPLGGPAGAATTVVLKGWNLPTDRLTMDARKKAPGIYPLSLRQGSRVSNTVPFAVDTLPECLDREPNNSSSGAQRITLPIIVNGRIDQPGDWDVFCFEGRAGQQIVAEVSARRLDSPLDSVLRLTNAAGKQLAFNDDQEDRASGLHTHHADSLLLATLPADGTFFVYLGDSQRQGGPEYAYRLRLSEPRPDFEIRVVPSNISGRFNRSSSVTVYALRKDGFAGEIALSLQGAPDKVTLNGGPVPGDKDQVKVTLTAARGALAEPPTPLSIEGRATIAGREVVHTAVPADDMMQAFAYHHLVPARDLLIPLSGTFPSPVAGRSDRTKPSKFSTGRVNLQNTAKLLDPRPVKIPAGGSTQVQIGLPPRSVRGEVELELRNPPGGITVDKVSLRADTMSFVLNSNAKKARPGQKGNLIVNVSVKTVETSRDGKKQDVRTPLGRLPGIPFEIVKP